MASAAFPFDDRQTSYTVSVASTGPFDIDFRLFTADGSDVVVLLDGEEVDPTDYTITATAMGADDPGQWTGGQMTFDTAITGDVVIRGNLEPARPTQFQTGRGIPPVQHNAALNRIVAVQQDLRRDVGVARQEIVDAVLGQIPDGSLTDIKLANMPAATVKGNVSGEAGAPANVSLVALLAALAAFQGDAGLGGVKGLVPAPAAGDAAANKVLGASGGWIDPPGATTGVVAYPSRAVVLALTVPAAITRIETHGYASAGDFGGGVYDRAGSAPSHAGYFQDAGGAYWVLDADHFVTLEQFGGGTGAASNTAALNAANAYCAATSCKLIQSRVGVYTFTTKPNDINEQVKLRGFGSSVTNWVRAYSEGGGNDVGFITFRETVAGGGGQLNGSGLIGIMLTAGNGTTGGTMLREITDGPITGYTLHDDLVITYSGTGTYHRCWLVDGLLNTTSGSQGYRDVRARDCFFFKGAAGTETCRFLNATNLDVEYWTNGDTVVYGGAASSTWTNNARLMLTSLAQLFIGRASKVVSDGEVDSLIHSADTDNCVHWGRVGSGGYSNTAGTLSNAVINRSHGFVANPALPGHQYFPTGLRIQIFQAASVGTSYANFAFPQAFSAGCTPIVIGSVRGAGGFVGVLTGTHTATNASLAVASGTQTVDCIAIGW